MTPQEKINYLQQQYHIVGTVDLDTWHTLEPWQQRPWLQQQTQALHRSEYTDRQRLVFYTTHWDANHTVLRELVQCLNSVDITLFFVILLCPVQNIAELQDFVQQHSQDSTAMTIHTVSTGYQYSSVEPLKIARVDLSQQQEFLLTQSRTFCIYPWIHIHAYPTGAAYPCCHAEMADSIGNTRNSTLESIWNDAPMRSLRQDMLAGRPNSACNRCYEQEASGFFSGRKSANKHHGHHIARVADTQADGTVAEMQLIYWDIRFSNLCNLRCRSCGHIFSSQWYQDQARLAGPEWKLANSVLNYAGPTPESMWQQLEPHLDYVEQIYFAGGEPLLMEEHYRILEELVRRKRFDVRLIYNTNFTHTDLKGRSVFDYWNLFESVSVGASLDDSGLRGEYIRKGTDWAQIEANRRHMQRTCPDVDFYISPTLSIMNAHHLPAFHRDWVEAGLIRPQDLNVNILQDPPYYRIDIAPAEYKQQLTELYTKHIGWLKSTGDPLGRATQGFESARTFLNATDNTHLIDSFWRRTHELDSIRNESCLDIIPELKALK